MFKRIEAVGMTAFFVFGYFLTVPVSLSNLLLPLPSDQVSIFRDATITSIKKIGHLGFSR